MDDRPSTFMVRSIDRWRRAISISRQQWLGHVLVQHPELTDQLEALHATLMNPEVVMHDTIFEDRENVYRPGLLPSPLDHLYLKVVVAFRHTDAGEVVTAYPTSQIKPGEVQKWP